MQHEMKEKLAFFEGDWRICTVHYHLEDDGVEMAIFWNVRVMPHQKVRIMAAADAYRKLLNMPATKMDDVDTDRPF